MKKIKVGIVGNGFVGEAQAFAFSPIAEIRIFDIDKNKSTHTIEETNKCDIVFVCVPTPMYQDGSQDQSYIEDVLKHAEDFPIYVLKSTLLPGTTKKLSKKYPHLKIIFSPEFLTERTAKLDMLTQSRIIIGGKQNLTKEVKELYNQRFMNRHIIETDSTTAEFIKYMNNTFLATKVSIINEFKLLSKKVGVNWEDAIHGFAADGRIGDSHLHVPGPDGKLGYGGTCFPKDVNAFIVYARQNGVDLNSIEGGWKTNLTVRPEKDWEKKIGRAITKTKSFEKK